MKANIPTLNLKSSRAAPAMTAGMEGQPVWTDYSSALSAIDGYAKNHVVFTCVHEISSSAGSVPFKLVRIKDGTEFDNHPILDLLKRPNPYQAASSFWECVYAFYLLHGNSYIEAADMAASESPTNIQELYCLPPKFMKIILGKKGIASYLFEGPTGMKVTYPVSMMNGQSFCMHWKTFNPDNIWVGQAAISALGKSVDIHNSTNAWNKALLDNGARPSGAFVYDDEEEGVLTEEQYDRLKEQIEGEYAGSKNAGKAMLLEGGMKWQAMSLTPMDMDFISSKNISARDIAVSYGYPPVLLGLPEDNTYNNQKEARLALWTDTIMPTVTSMCDHLNRWLLPLFNEDENEIRIEADYEQIGALQPIRDAQWEKAKESHDFLTTNERRELVGYERKKEYDVILVNATQIPLSEAAKGFGGTSNDKPSNDDNKSILKKASQIPMELKATTLSDSREADAQNKLRLAIERLFVPPLYLILDKAAREAADNYKRKKSSESALSILSEKISSEVPPVLRKMYIQTSEVSGARVFEGIKSISDHLEQKQTEFQTRFEFEMVEWASSEALSASAAITETTIDTARKVFVQSIIDGDSIQQVSQKLYDSVGGTISKARAEKTAATEVHKAYNVAGYAAMQATELEFDKRWLSVSDSSVRPSHAAASGITIDQNERFKIGAAFLRFPGDPSSAHPEEVINCRCAVRYIPKGI